MCRKIVVDIIFPLLLHRTIRDGDLTPETVTLTDDRVTPRVLSRKGPLDRILPQSKE